MRTYRALPQQDSHTAIGYMIVVQIAAGVVLAVWGLSSAAPAAVTGVVAAIVIAGWWCCTQIREARSFWTRILFHINGSHVSVGIPVEFADIPATGGPPDGHAGRRRRTGPYSGGHRYPYRRTFW